MSKLYGELTSDSRKNGVTTRGHKRIYAHVRGWDIGVEVVASLGEDGNVRIIGRLTGGSNDPTPISEPLFSVAAAEGRKV